MRAHPVLLYVITTIAVTRASSTGNVGETQVLIDNIDKAPDTPSRTLQLGVVLPTKAHFSKASLSLHGTWQAAGTNPAAVISISSGVCVGVRILLSIVLFTWYFFTSYPI